jgi:hypothetical protein
MLWCADMIKEVCKAEKHLNALICIESSKFYRQNHIIILILCTTVMVFIATSLLHMDTASKCGVYSIATRVLCTFEPHLFKTG